jgi:hypothetical protein
VAEIRGPGRPRALRSGRCRVSGPCTFTEKLLDGDFLDGVDILIIVSFDSQRASQHPDESELAAIRKFLDDPGHSLFVCPHHDIVNVDGVPSSEVLTTQEVEFHHHGDLGVPGQQRFGGFARSLLRDLGVPVSDNFRTSTCEIAGRVSGPHPNRFSSGPI